MLTTENNANFAIRINKETLEKFREECARRGLKHSQVVRNMIASFVSQNKEGNIRAEVEKLKEAQRKLDEKLEYLNQLWKENSVVRGDHLHDALLTRDGGNPVGDSYPHRQDRRRAEQLEDESPF